jgi:prepilin-type N-terminal cleavage/methylation domain-containing protein
MVSIIPSDYDKGFTLVELAISLMVIGLLIGGVLKGQELIENARITRTIKDINDFDTAIMIFRGTYNDALPGDFRHPNRIPNCTSAPCNLAGNGDRIIYSGNYQERLTIWWHLYNAGLISNIDTSKTTVTLNSALTISPPSQFSGHYTPYHSSAASLGSHTSTPEHPAVNLWFISDNNLGGSHTEFLSCQRISSIDQKMDDGKPMTGQVKILVNQHNSQLCYDVATAEYIADSKARTFPLVESTSLK